VSVCKIGFEFGILSGLDFEESLFLFCYFVYNYHVFGMICMLEPMLHARDYNDVWRLSVLYGISR
jgi:hypothetical protein